MNMRSIEWIAWGGLILIALSIAGAFAYSRLGASPLPVLGEVPRFELTDQNGRTIAHGDLRGQVWVANIIFTRCPTICVQLTRSMRELQEQLSHDKAVKLISLTADPEHDTPPVLKTYGQRFGAVEDRWHFLTGPRRDVYRLAIDGLKFVVVEKDPDDHEMPNDLFIHTAKFALVDKQGRLRGWFDGDDPESVKKIAPAVKSLLRER